MNQLATILGTAALTLVASPVIAHAADAAAPAAQPGAAGIIAAIAAGAAGLLTAGAAAIAAIRSSRVAAAATQHAADATAQAAQAQTQATTASAQAQQAGVAAVAADRRAQAAMAWADKLANAQHDGVVLVLSYPDTAASCRGLLELNGWRVAYYPVTAAEVEAGQFLPGGERLLADVSSADAIVIEGLPEAGVAQLAATRDLRDRVRSGASVVLATGSRNFRYDLTPWGEVACATNMPVTTESAVRASLARREVVARSQGIRPGTLAAAREALLAS